MLFSKTETASTRVKFCVFCSNLLFEYRKRSIEQEKTNNKVAVFILPVLVINLFRVFPVSIYRLNLGYN